MRLLGVIAQTAPGPLMKSIARSGFRVSAN